MKSKLYQILQIFIIVYQFFYNRSLIGTVLLCVTFTNCTFARQTVTSRETTAISKDFSASV